MLEVRHAVVGPFGENTWLVADRESGDAIVIDPGGETARVLGLAQPDLRIVGVIATHGHVDHVAGAEELCRRTGAPFRIHAGDERLVRGLPTQAAALGFGAVKAPALGPFLADGETLQVGRHAFTVLHTPGHTPGGVCFHFPEEQLLVTGDTLFAASVGRTDLPGGNTAELLRSIRDRLFPLADATRFLPGHGPTGTIGEERSENPFVGERAGRMRPM